jgi:hypothetical protein
MAEPDRFRSLVRPIANRRSGREAKPSDLSEAKTKNRQKPVFRNPSGSAIPADAGMLFQPAQNSRDGAR